MITVHLITLFLLSDVQMNSFFTLKTTRRTRHVAFLNLPLNAEALSVEEDKTNAGLVLLLDPNSLGLFFLLELFEVFHALPPNNEPFFPPFSFSALLGLVVHGERMMSICF